MKTVYRVACITDLSRGMYRSEIAHRHLNDVDTLHPAPRNDDLLMQQARKSLGTFNIPNNYYYGFDSIAQMRRWIYRDSIFDMLYEAEYVVYELQVPDHYVLVGYTQTVFEMEHAKVMRTLPLDELSSKDKADVTE